jgi:peroxiredoxin
LCIFSQLPFSQSRISSPEADLAISPLSQPSVLLRQNGVHLVRLFLQGLKPCKCVMGFIICSLVNSAKYKARQVCRR